MKVEQALRLLPGLESLGPLRGLVLASSSADDQARWGSAGPYLTVGKWTLSVDLLRRGVPQLLERISEHLTALYQHYADALDSEEAGDQAAVVVHLLSAARLEESVGRFGPALRWGELARQVAEGLNVRTTEIETLIFLAGVDRSQGSFLEAGRNYQRALALAEAESDRLGAIDASEGQGLVALALGQFAGSKAWLSRAERLADAPEDSLRRGRIARALAEVAMREGALSQASERLRAALQEFEGLGAAEEMARTLDLQGRLELALGSHAVALAAWREALAWTQRVGRSPRIECAIRLHLAELFLSLERVSEAEEEMRHAERLAIGHDLGRRLIQIYSRLGELRGHQGDETGYVFFEQAIALCQMLEASPSLEGEVYQQYGRFKLAIGHVEEGEGLLEHARERFAASGGGPSLHTDSAWPPGRPMTHPVP